MRRPDRERRNAAPGGDDARRLLAWVVFCAVFCAPMPVSAYLNAMRIAMRDRGVAAVVVPSADPHLSEYLPERWNARRRFSGFTGSAGTLVVTLDTACVFTDSRYFEQAGHELAGSGIELVRLTQSAATEHVDWLVRTLARGDVVAIAADVQSLASQALMQRRCAAAGLVLRTDLDLAGLVWTDRPALPDAPAVEHRAPFVDSGRAERLARVRTAMRETGAATTSCRRSTTSRGSPRCAAATCRTTRCSSRIS